MLPYSRVLQVILALVYHELGKHGRCVELLLRNLVESTSDPGIQRYRRAVPDCAPRVAARWDQG
jgi:predicted Zn-dependent protease